MTDEELQAIGRVDLAKLRAVVERTSGRRLPQADREAVSSRASRSETRGDLTAADPTVTAGPRPSRIDAPVITGMAPSGGSSVSTSGGVEVAAPVARATTPDPAPGIVRRDQVTIQLSDDGGEVGRIRVTVNGPSVRATIIPHDPALADRLNDNLRELRRSLEGRGFAEPRVSIQAPRPIEVTPVGPGRDIVFDLASPEPRASGRPSGDDGRRHGGNDAEQSSAGREQRQRSPDRSKSQRQEQERSNR